MTQLTNSYNESKNYSEDIIKNICKILDKNKIGYKLKSNDTEIVLSKKNDAKKIEKMIQKEIDVPKMVFILLVTIVQVDDTVYIRQKLK